MRIKMLQALSGPATDIAVGDVLDMETAEAVRHIAAGHAIPYAESRIETPEKPKAAVEKRAPAKRRKKKK